MEKPVTPSSRIVPVLPVLLFATVLPAKPEAPQRLPVTSQVARGVLRGAPATAGVVRSAPSASGSEDASSLTAAARVVRPASAEEAARAHSLALQSAELAASRARLAPLTIDTSSPRAVGTTIGQVAVYYPVHGAMDGPASQVGLWFDAASGRVVGEAAFVRTPEGIHARLASDGRVLYDGILDEPAGTTDGDFWDCLERCLGLVADQDILVILRSACLKYCSPWPALWCQGCLMAVGVLEAGMISGCTYDCWRG
jgi:hypothetical protein